MKIRLFFYLIAVFNFFHLLYGSSEEINIDYHYLKQIGVEVNLEKVNSSIYGDCIHISFYIKPVHDDTRIYGITHVIKYGDDFSVVSVDLSSFYRGHLVGNIMLSSSKMIDASTVIFHDDMGVDDIPATKSYRLRLSEIILKEEKRDMSLPLWLSH